MNTGKTIFELDQAVKVPAGSRYIVEMGDGSGTKSVTHEDVVAAVGEYLPLGEIGELKTDVKTDYVSAINEIKEKADASSGGATLQVKTSDPGLYGRTVTVSDGENEMSAVMSYGGECVVTGILMTGDLSVSASTETGETDETTVTISDYATYRTELDTRQGYNHLNVITYDTGLFGRPVSISNGTDTMASVISHDGQARFVFQFSGIVTVSATDNTGHSVSMSVNVVSDNTASYRVQLQSGNMISDAFLYEKAYAVGDFAIYENALYKFTAAKAAGDWDNTKVQKVTVERVLRELNENIAKKQDASTAITTGNIGQQSVNYAATAGSATTASTANAVAWGGVSGKPSVYPPSSHNHDDRYYAISSGNGVLNTEYLNSGECYWRKMGRVCYVYAEFIPKKQFEDLCLLFSGLPGAAMDQNFFYPAIQADETVRNGLLRIMTNGEIHEFYYFKTAMGKKTKVGFMYITA